MNKITLTLFITLCSLTFSFAQQKKTERAVIKTTIFCDHCKACETCGKNIQSKILKTNGVKMFELDEKAMTITVYYNPKKTNLENIRTAISKLGYDADDLKADPLAYEQLDNCCKKA